MGNFASSALCQQQVRSRASAPVSTLRRFVDSLKTSVVSIYDDLLTSFAGTSVVLSELDDAWYLDIVGQIDAIKAQSEDAVFLGPSDTTVASVASLNLSTKSWHKSASNEDDDTSAEETDDESKCDFSDCEAEDDSDDEVACTDCCCISPQPQDVEYYKEDDDTETKADRLLRLASMGSNNDMVPVYVVDYLCPCGECPQYARIAHDVQTVVTWRGPKEQASIIRVLQAFSTYNEVIGYSADMIDAAEECLQLWLGDEDRALHSFVMLYDEVPQLCAEQL